MTKENSVKERPVVLITGANNGIGLAMASALLKDGYRVAAFDLNGNHLLRLLAMHPETLHIGQCDVTQPDEIKKAVTEVINKWNTIDVLVNNACLALFGPFEEKKIKETRLEFEINYFGYIRMIKEVLPYMKAKGKGLIHNMSSGVGVTGFPGIYGYSSTKGAIEALSLSLSYELAPHGISVNVMHPPLTNTQSAAPLGIPSQVMANPEIVGRQLAKKIMSTKPVVTPNFQASLFLFLARRFPHAIGRFLGKLAEKERNNHQGGTLA